MRKITIKTFCKEYNNRANDTLKKQYIKDNLEITPYVSFVKKDALISNLLKATMIDKETGNVKVNSSAEYLLKTRILIENYTNLTVETDGFYEEYDELKKLQSSIIYCLLREMMCLLIAMRSTALLQNR